VNSAMSLDRLKALAYGIVQSLMRGIWRASGGRRINAFGERLRVVPETVFPSYRKLRLPQGEAKSEIVRYADFVQAHAAMNYIATLERAATVVDIGAHHGAYAVLLGKALKKLGGKVIAVEPNPLCFDVLVRNVLLNDLADVVSCEQCAILDRAGIVNISLGDSESRVLGPASAGSVTAEAVTLEMLIKKHSIAAIDLLIIDVEGAELPVLRGFPWGTTGIGRIFCELHPYAWAEFGYCAQDVRDFLRVHSLRCMDMYLTEYNAFADSGYIGPTVLSRQGGGEAPTVPSEMFR
jgi:FkbM family methyltransferase